MAITTQQRRPWQRVRKQAAARAKQLEKEAAIHHLVSLADDPFDAFATLSDLAFLARRRVLVRNARLHGHPTPAVPFRRRGC